MTAGTGSVSWQPLRWVPETGRPARGRGGKETSGLAAEAQPPENPRLVVVGLGWRSSRASASEEDGLGPGQQFQAILHRAGRRPGLKSTGQA